MLLIAEKTNKHRVPHIGQKIKTNNYETNSLALFDDDDVISDELQTRNSTCSHSLARFNCTCALLDSFFSGELLKTCFRHTYTREQRKLELPSGYRPSIKSRKNGSQTHMGRMAETKIDIYRLDTHFSTYQHVWPKEILFGWWDRIEKKEKCEEKNGEFLHWITITGSYHPQWTCFDTPAWAKSLSTNLLVKWKHSKPNRFH